MGTLTINQLLQANVDQGASDLHLRVHQPPLLRVKGDLVPVAGAPALTNEWMKEIVTTLMGSESERSKRLDTLNKEREIDLAYALEGQARFRVNMFFEQGRISVVMRRIPEEIPLPEEIGLPAVARTFAEMQRGMVLVTGPTGSGKSTSIAAIIRVINETRPVSILTLEDPIEFVHRPVRAVVRQREVGRDMHSFARGLRAAMRQDPDVILIGEMRDRETIEIALTAAETGHLVFGTLHTRSAEGTIDRVVDVFPANQQDQIRTQLSNSLQAIMCQILLPRSDTDGRVAAHEILLATPAVRNLVRRGNPAQIRSTMQTNSNMGMQTMDKSLADLARAGKVDVELARERAQDENEFNKLIAGEARSFRLERGDTPAPKRSGAGISMRQGH